MVNVNLGFYTQLTVIQEQKQNKDVFSFTKTKWIYPQETLTKVPRSEGLLHEEM